MFTTTTDENELRTILIIDDDPFVLVGLKTLLERCGHNVMPCNTPLSGITLAKDLLPDLIVCDIMMPLMDGFTVQVNLASDPLTRDIPFLFLSARASQTDKLRGLENGADDYITKPFDPRELVARINAIFRRKDIDRQGISQEMDFQIDRIKTEISNNVSHELRTPMTQILMSLEMVLRNKYNDPEELKWFVETALSQSHRLNATIDDLTFLNCQDLGHRCGMRQLIDIENDFKIYIVQRQELYKDKKLNTEIHVDKEVVIHAPRREFRQAITHLVDNSLKFAPPKASIQISLAANGKGGCIFTVTDCGSGVPSGLHEKVFERYYQISQGDTRAYGGLGVGLTISRMIARSIGGDVQILPVETGFSIQMVLPPGLLEDPW